MSETWNGANSGTSLWDSPSNWSPSGVPNQSSDIVTIGESGSYNVIIANTDPTYTIRSLSIGGIDGSQALSVFGQLNIQKLVSLSGSAALAIGASGYVSTSRLSLSAGSTVSDLGSLNVSGTFAGSGSVAINAGEIFTNSIAGTNSYVLSNSATMTISDSVSSSGAIIFSDGSTDTLNLDSAGTSFGASVSGFGGGDAIDIGSLPYSSQYTIQYSNSTLVINNGSSPLFTFNDIDNPGTVHLADDGAGGTEILTCFLPGTRILTMSGEVLVERLTLQDEVATVADGLVTYKPIKWIGVRHLNRRAVATVGIKPVRILAGAFEGGIPSHDLFVTPEHCIYVENCFIPARMLLNGQSVVEEEKPEGFSYYHVELEQHAIIIANGLLTESYLDTGNRSNFSNADTVGIRKACHVGIDFKSWASSACAPLKVDRETVEYAWRRLKERAQDLGLPDQTKQRKLEEDPNLRLVLDSGEQITSSWVQSGKHFFQIPFGRTGVGLLSRAASPAQVLGPYVDDRRRLGVKVKTLVLWSGLNDTVYESRILSLSGWHDLEGEARWTSGYATLNLPAADNSETFLSVHVVDSLTYPRENVATNIAA